MLDMLLLLLLTLFIVNTMVVYLWSAFARLFMKDKVFIKKDFSFQPTVTILLPCFNEGAHVRDTINSILKSDYPKEKLDIVIVDDHSSDDSWDHIQDAQRGCPDQIIAMRHEVNQGKYMALVHAAEKAKGEFVICIDSDCIFKEDAVKNLMACFVDPQMGGVGGVVGVSNANKNLLTKMQTFWYFYAFHLHKMAENLQRTVFCISGCLFAIRKSAFEKIKAEVEAHSFMGEKFTAGEDRYMTHMLLLNGYKTYLDIEAQCWTEVPDKFTKFFMQQVRWTRGGMEQIYVTLTRLDEYVKRFNAVSLMCLFTPLITRLTYPFIVLWTMFGGVMAQNLLEGQMFLLASFTVVWYFTIQHMKKISPEQLVDGYLLVVPLMSIWIFIGGFFITLISACTLDSNSWGTRNKPKVGA